MAMLSYYLLQGVGLYRPSPAVQQSDSRIAFRRSRHEFRESARLESRCGAGMGVQWIRPACMPKCYIESTPARKSVDHGQITKKRLNGHVCAVCISRLSTSEMVLLLSKQETMANRERVLRSSQASAAVALSTADGLLCRRASQRGHVLLLASS